MNIFNLDEKTVKIALDAEEKMRQLLIDALMKHRKHFIRKNPTSSIVPIEEINLFVSIILGGIAARHFNNVINYVRIAKNGIIGSPIIEEKLEIENAIKDQIEVFFCSCFESLIGDDHP